MNTLKVKIICSSESVHDMHDLAKYLRPPSMKGESAVNIFLIAYIQQIFHMDIDW